MTLFGGSTFNAKIQNGFGQVNTQAGQGFRIDGLLTGATFSTDPFAGVSITPWFSAQPLDGAFLNFSFNPNANGFDMDTDIDIYLIPAPHAGLVLGSRAWAWRPGVARLSLLSARLRLPHYASNDEAAARPARPLAAFGGSRLAARLWRGRAARLPRFSDPWTPLVFGAGCIFALPVSGVGGYDASTRHRSLRRPQQLSSVGWGLGFAVAPARDW